VVRCRALLPRYFVEFLFLPSCLLYFIRVCLWMGAGICTLYCVLVSLCKPTAGQVSSSQPHSCNLIWQTTQVPHLILANEMQQGRGHRCQIICTQPRRISAIRRVCMHGIEVCRCISASCMSQFHVSRMNRHEEAILSGSGLSVLYCCACSVRFYKHSIINPARVYWLTFADNISSC